MTSSIFADALLAAEMKSYARKKQPYGVICKKKQNIKHNMEKVYEKKKQHHYSSTMPLRKAT